MDVLLLSIFGFAVTAILLFLVIRNLQAVIFWSALMAPAIGASLVHAAELAIAGDYNTAVNSLEMLPFFIASVDKAFFTSTDEVYFYVGIVFLFVWSYIIAHYAVKKFGMWALPVIPAMIWGVGLTLVNFRMAFMTRFPNFAFLFDYYGIPALVLVSSLLFLVCYLIWRRGYSLQKVPMWTPKLTQG